MLGQMKIFPRVILAYINQKTSNWTRFTWGKRNEKNGNVMLFITTQPAGVERELNKTVPQFHRKQRINIKRTNLSEFNHFLCKKIILFTENKVWSINELVQCRKRHKMCPIDFPIPNAYIYVSDKLFIKRKAWISSLMETCTRQTVISMLISVSAGKV